MAETKIRVQVIDEPCDPYYDPLSPDARIIDVDCTVYTNRKSNLGVYLAGAIIDEVSMGMANIKREIYEQNLNSAKRTLS